MSVEGQDMADILIGPHDDHAAAVSIHAAHRVNVAAASKVGAEDLFVILKPVAAFARHEKRGHIFEAQPAMVPLKHRPNIKNRDRKSVV